MKIAINTCFGGFSLSDKARERLVELGIPLIEDSDAFYELETPAVLRRSDTDDHLSFMGRYSDNFTRDTSGRNHPLLIQVIEELGKEASGRFGDLRVVEIPDDVEWEISEYDGNEHIAEKHRTWR